MKKLLLTLLFLAGPAFAQTQVGPAYLPANNAFTGQNTFPTQPTLDNTTLAATDAFVTNDLVRAKANQPVLATGGIYNLESQGTGLSVVVLALSGPVTEILTIANPGSGYAVGDILRLKGGNLDATIRVTAIGSGGTVPSASDVQITSNGTGYTTGATVVVEEPPVNAYNTITYTGAMTSNMTVILPAGTFIAQSRLEEINNNSTGPYTIHYYLSNGSGGTIGNGVVIPQGSNNSCATWIQTDGETDVWYAAPPVCLENYTFASPTFTGTVTGPDGSVWTVSGLGSLKALGVNETVPATGDVNVSGQYQVAGAQIAASNLSNGTTGSGAIVLSTSPTLVAPALGTPSSGVATHLTGLPLTTGVTGTLGVANGGTGTATSTGTGSVVLNTSPTLVTPALGTPSSGVATNLTGLPLTTGVTGTLPIGNGGTNGTTDTAALSNLLGNPVAGTYSIDCTTSSSCTSVGTNGAYTQTVSVSGTTTLTSSQLNSIVSLGGTAPYTVSLPNPSTVVNQSALFYNTTSGNITLNISGGGDILGANVPGTASASFVIGSEQAVRLAAVSGSGWVVESPQTTQTVGGYGTSYINETGSRAIGTTYTNSTGGPISVKIDLFQPSSNGSIEEYVNGVEIGNPNLLIDYNTEIDFVVPSSDTYEIVPYASTPTLTSWFELEQ